MCRAIRFWVAVAMLALSACATYEWTVEECENEAIRRYLRNGSYVFVLDYDTLMCCAGEDCRSIGY